MKSKKILPILLATFSCLPASITKSTEKKQISAPVAATAGFLGGALVVGGGTAFALYPKYENERINSAKKDNEICDLKNKLKNTELELKENKEDKEKLLQALGYTADTVVNSDILNYCRKADKLYMKYNNFIDIKKALVLQRCQKVGKKNGVDIYIPYVFSKDAPLDVEGITDEGKKRISFYFRCLRRCLDYFTNDTNVEENGNLGNYLIENYDNLNHPFWQD